MTLTHDDANARLLDLVYGEGSPAARAALEAHVATCAQCTADLAALGDTRARVRTALDDAPVPARVHARILEAATQAAAPIAAAASAAAASAPALAAAAPAPARASVPAPARGPSFWEKLRGRWTLPTFATVGAVAIVAIASKVFLEPQHTMELGREVAQAPAAAPAEPAREAAENAAASAPAAEAKAAPADEIRAAAPHRFVPGAGAEAFNRARGGRPGPFGGGSLADKLAHHGASGAGAGLDGLGSLGSATGRGPAAAPPAPLPPRAKGSLDDLLEGSLERKPTAANQPRARASVAVGGKAEEESQSDRPAQRRDFAPPPSGWKGGAPSAPAAAAPAPAASPPPAAAPAPPPPARVASAPARNVRRKEADELDPFAGGVPAASEVADSRVEGAAAPTSLAKKKAAPPKPVVAAATPASEPQMAPREKAPVADNAAPAKSARAPAGDAEKARADADKDSKQDAAAPSQEALTRRADQLFAARRWSEAIAAYRELLRRYPDADLKPRWRARITQAEAEADPTSTPAKAPSTASKKASAKSKVLLDAEPAK